MLRMTEAYEVFASCVASRAAIETEDGAHIDVLVMYAPSFQSMMFDFYALVTLARITLDSLRMYLRPVFATDFGQIPKSFRRILRGETDCPVYTRLGSMREAEYLCDLRDCLMHYRSLASNDNAIVIDGNLPSDERESLDLEEDWFASMARAEFRRLDSGIVVNVFVPDRIFDCEDGVKKLAEFTYDNRRNLIPAARDFTLLVQQAIVETFELLANPGSPTFTWHKP